MDENTIVSNQGGGELVPNNNAAVDDDKPVKCLNCGTVYNGRYCPHCGQSADTGRFTLKFMFQNLLAAILSNDGGVLFTLKKLFCSPGQMVLDIINGKRKVFLILLIIAKSVPYYKNFYRHNRCILKFLLTNPA